MGCMLKPYYYHEDVIFFKMNEVETTLITLLPLDSGSIPYEVGNTLMKAEHKLVIKI